MSTFPTLKVELRDVEGSTKSVKLRKSGYIPAVVYGKDFKPVSLQIKYEDFAKVIKAGERLIELSATKMKEKVLVKEVSYDEVTERVRHVDFHRISLTDKIEVKVPLKFKKHAIGALEDGVVDEHMTDIMVKCLPESIPHFIDVDISQTKIGDIIHAKDIKLPEGTSLGVKPDAIVITVHKKMEEVVAVAAAPEPGAAEPEVITAKKEKEGEEEEGVDEKKKPGKEEKAPADKK